MSAGKASIIEMRGLKPREETWGRKHGQDVQRPGNLITFRMEETGIKEILGTGKNLLPFLGGSLFS